MKKASLLVLTVIGLALFFVGSYSVHGELNKMESLTTLSNRNADEFYKASNEFERAYNAN